MLVRLHTTTPFPPPLLRPLQDLLSRVPPLLLLTLFEDLKPDTPIFYSAPSTGGRSDGGAAGRLMRAADVALGVKATVQVGQLPGHVLVVHFRLLSN